MEPRVIQNPVLYGIRKIAPIYPGVIPFGIVYGSLSAAFGYTFFETFSLSWLIFAGASQIIQVQLLKDQVSALVVVLTALAVNSRMLLYGIRMNLDFGAESFLRKIGIAYFLTDQSFVVSTHFFEEVNATHRQKILFYFGAAVSMWAVWQISTIVGWHIGSILPSHLELDFFIPLTFLAISAKYLRNKKNRWIFILAGTSALLLKDIPFHMNLLCGMVFGVVFGSLFFQPKGKK